MKSYMVIMAFVCLLCSISHGQFVERYQLDLNRELGLTAAGALISIAGLNLKKTITPYSQTHIAPIDVNAINAVDRVATKFSSLTAERSSDILGYTSFAMPFLFLSNSQSRPDAARIGLVWSEVILINAGLTTMSKNIFKRPRPYVFRQSDNTYDKTSRTAQASFVSGHTSMMASNMFFFAKTFSVYFPESKLKPIVWGVAISTPAIMGYLRVRAGVHYPTDVMAGYGLGALTGILVPAIHTNRQNKNVKTAFTLVGHGNQIGFQLTF
mgnify:CR=1 FL=1